MATQPMKVTLTASTGVKLQVWREDDLFHAVSRDELVPPQICLGVDLFEVLAELSGLDLEDSAQAGEAASLAEEAKSELALATAAATTPPEEGGADPAETEHGHRA